MMNLGKKIYISNFNIKYLPVSRAAIFTSGLWSPILKNLPVLGKS